MRLSVGRRASQLVSLLVLVSLWVATPRTRAAEAPGRKGAASESRTVTRAAMDALRAGGNAVDAAVTAALVAGVVSPSSSGLGGGGFAMVWHAAERRVALLDFRETAPAVLDPAPFESRPFADAERARATGTPGEVAGLYELHSRFGKRKWADVVRPAAGYAQNGFAVEGHLASVLALPQAKRIQDDARLSEMFFKGGRPAAAGTRITNPRLAQTLRRIAAEGPRAFYQGSIAADLVTAARSKGGTLALSDLANYRVKERTPLRVSWDGHEVYTMPPPSAGGLLVAQVLMLFSRAELERLGHNSGAYQHVLAEAMRGALSDRLRYAGDPDVIPVDVEGLLAPKRMAARKRRIAYDRTHTLPRFGLEEQGTHHMVVADREGNVVSLTTTINSGFGAKVSGAESGVVLNDELHDFTSNKDVKAFGLSESPNRPRAGARPVSSMTPTIVVRDGRPVAALGGSGGMTISLNVTQVLLSHLVFDLDPAAAVKAPRFFVPTSGATLRLDPGSDPALLEDLRWRGEIVEPKRWDAAAVQLLAFGPDGTVRAAADARKHGSAEIR